MASAEAPRAVGAVKPVDLRDYVAFREEAATRTRIFATDVLTYDVWCLEPLQSTGPLLYADVDVAYTVIGGSGWFVTDEGEIGLDPLGAMLVSAGVGHGIDNRSADPLVVTAAAAPPDVALDALATDTPIEDVGAAVKSPPEPGVIKRALQRWAD